MAKFANDTFANDKLANDTAVICLITDGNKTAYRSKVDHLAQYSQDNSLAHNAYKTMELVVDVKRKRQIQDPIAIKM